ncbi:MAG TPA: hypothetical protein PLD88_07935, partial [Candidatus Berkiella sp.]|nr:hypothetical protein [Candidatus Berkiella sp.]
GIVNQAEVEELISAYKPCLLALDYSLNESKDKITLYSHGVIGLDNINYIATALGMDVMIDEHTPAVKIAAIIEEINQNFKEHVQRNTVTDLLKLDQVDTRALNGIIPIDAQKFPFAHLVWNRRTNSIVRPQHINFVHGHDMGDKTQDNIFNLDNILGKALSAHEGQYNVLCSNEMTLRSELTNLEKPSLPPRRPKTREPAVTQPKPSNFDIIEDYHPIAQIKSALQVDTKSLDEALEKGWKMVEPEKEIENVQSQSANTNAGWFSGVKSYASSLIWGSPVQQAEKTAKPKMQLEPAVDSNPSTKYVTKSGKIWSGDLSQSIREVAEDEQEDLSKSTLFLPSFQSRTKYVTKSGEVWNGDLSQSIREVAEDEQEDLSKSILFQPRTSYVTKSGEVWNGDLSQSICEVAKDRQEDLSKSRIFG